MQFLPSTWRRYGLAIQQNRMEMVKNSRALFDRLAHHPLPGVSSQMNITQSM